MTHRGRFGLAVAGAGLVLGLAVCPVAAQPAAPSPGCEIATGETTIDLRLVPEGTRPFVVAVKTPVARIRPLEDRITVESPLRIETRGALAQPLRLSRTLLLPGGLGYLGPSEELGLSRDQQTLKATAKLGYVTLGPLPVPCDALELGERGRGRRLPRRTTSPETATASLSAQLDTLFASAKGVWVGKVPVLRMYAAAKDDAPYVELRASYSRDLRLLGLGSEGAFVRAGVRGTSAAVAGFVKSADVEPEQPRGAGGIGMLGSSCQDEVEPPADFVGEAEVAAGTILHAAPGVGPWAELPATRKLSVRYRAGALVAGSEWVQITAIPDVAEVLRRDERGYGECVKTALRHAYVKLAAVTIPQLAAVRQRAESTRVAPLGVAAVAAARKRLGLDSEAVGTLALHHDLGCYLKKGRVLCFGDVPGTAGSDSVVELPGLTDAVQVAVGGESVCVVRSGGAVACLGTPPAGQTAAWTPLPELSPSVALGAGSSRLCAVRSDGRLTCIEGKGPARDLEGLGDAVAVSVGGSHACVLRASGGAACFGSNSDGQLGSGDTRPRAGLVEVSGLSGLVRIAAGRSHTCAQKADGALYCFGQNRSGELAPGYRDLLVPTEIKTRDLRELSAGDGYTCGLSATGVSCFGRSVVETGLVAGGFSYQGAAAAIGGLSGVRRLAMGGDRACALLDDGKLRCWGARTVRRPVLVAGLNDGGRTVRKLRAGHRSMCALLDDGNVRCWPQEDRDRPEFGPSPGARDFDVSAGSACRIEADGRVYCPHGHAPPGEGPASLLAIATSISCAVRGGKLHCSSDEGSIDTRPENQGEVVQAAAAYRRACTVEKSGRVVCFETAERGEGKAPPPPQVVPGVTDAVQVALGIGVTCLRYRDGRLSCDTGEGQAPLGPVSDAVSLSVGATQACAVRRDGTVWCAPFEFGYAKRRRGYQPLAPVAGFADAVEVETGEGVTCARHQNGAVSCYGRCDGGRCDGSPKPYPVPGS